MEQADCSAFADNVCCLDLKVSLEYRSEAETDTEAADAGTEIADDRTAADEVGFGRVSINFARTTVAFSAAQATCSFQSFGCSKRVDSLSSVDSQLHLIWCLRAGAVAGLRRQNRLHLRRICLLIDLSSFLSQ